jgi:cystathionine gamma-synthase
MRNRPELRSATLLAQALGEIDAQTGALVPPLHTATTFARDTDYKPMGGRVYARDEMPSLEPPERLLARLEGAERALLFSSGIAAATAVFQALAPGDHVAVPRVMYYALKNWLHGFARPWGLEIGEFDGTDLATLEAVLRPGKTKIVWIETPANPTWAVTDIAAAASLAHRAGAQLGVDSTCATPIHTRPIEFGADIVMHAATKYLNGHSDVLGGALALARMDALAERIKYVRYAGGAILGPFEGWLLLRGMRTLALRVERASATALAIAERFAGDRRVLSVLYPGLPGDPGHAVARKQMQGGFGGMLSIRVGGGETAAARVTAQVEVFKRATSLGGVESLIEHRRLVEGPSSATPADLLRLSVGIEDPADLIADLDIALG